MQCILNRPKKQTILEIVEDVAVMSVAAYTVVVPVAGVVGDGSHFHACPSSLLGSDSP